MWLSLHTAKFFSYFFSHFSLRSTETRSRLLSFEMECSLPGKVLVPLCILTKESSAAVHLEIDLTAILRPLPLSVTTETLAVLHRKNQVARESKGVIITPVTIKTRCCQKKFECQRYPPDDFCTTRYEHKSSIFFQTFQKPEKEHCWADLGPISA